MQKQQRQKATTFLCDLLPRARHVKGHALNSSSATTSRHGPVSGPCAENRPSGPSCHLPEPKPEPKLETAVSEARACTCCRAALGIIPAPLARALGRKIEKEGPCGHKVSLVWQIYGLLRGPYTIFRALYIIHF